MTFLTLSAGLYAQKPSELPVPALPIDERTKLVTYQNVVGEPGKPSELYGRAMKWVKDYYKNTAEVIKSADSVKCVISLRSSVRIYYIMKDGTKYLKNVVYYNLKIECRDNRYRYTITDFNEKAQAAQPIERWFDTESPSWDPSKYDFLNQIDEQIQSLTTSLEDGMLPPEEFNDDW